jgi:hypothetical protein
VDAARRKSERGGPWSGEEAAGVDVEGGEAGKRTRTSGDEESRACERIDDRETKTASQPVDDEATDTPDPHAKCAELTRPVGMPHEPADELFGEREGASGEPESISPPIEGRSGRIPTDRADERKLPGDDLNGMAKFRGAKDRVEGSTTRHSVLIEERGSATARIRSTTTADENDQHDEAIVDDLPEDSSVSPEPPEPPDDPAKRRTQSPSVELEGERMTAASCDVEPAEGEPDASVVPEHVEDDCERQMKLRNKSECVGERWKPRCRKNSPGRPQVELDDPDDEADVLAASGRVEDDWKQPKNLRNASEHERKRSKRRSREDSPDKARGDPDRPDGETAVPGDFQRPQERPTSFSNERVDETNAPRRRNSPGSCLGEPEASRGVEGVRERGTVVDSAEHDGISPRSVRNERELETNARTRRTRPGGHMGEPKASRDVEGDWSRESGVDGVEYNGRRGDTDGATSGARCDSQRVETRPLAGDKGQYQQVERDITTDIPEASTPPPNDPKRPVELPNPPRRRGRMKSRPRKVNRTKEEEVDLPNRTATSRPKQAHRAHRICRIRSPDAGGASRQDTGTARHCRGRGYKIARTECYPSRDLPYMDIARRSRTRTLDPSHRSFDINSFHRNMKGIHYFVFYLHSFDLPHTL